MTFDTRIILHAEFSERSENEYMNIHTQWNYYSRNNSLEAQSISVDFIAVRQKYLSIPSKIVSKNVINSCSGHALI